MTYRYLDAIGARISEERTPDFAMTCDVLVVGAGTTGAITAQAAAALGSSVIAIDRLTFAGGLFSAGVFGYYYGSPGGIFEKADAYAHELAAKAGVTERPVHFSRTARILAHDIRFQETGVQVIDSAVLLGVYTEGRSIRGVRIFRKGETIDIACKSCADGTSEAYLCDMAGCELMMGREFDGRTQPFSCISLKVPKNGGKVIANNTDFGYVDQSDAEKLAKAILSGADKLLVPPYGEMVPLGEACMPGTREGRIIVGETTLSFKDWIENGSDPDSLFYAYSNIDDHGKDMAFESAPHADWMVGMSMWGTTCVIGIPAGCVISKDFDNLVVAGRCLSMDHDISASVRMIRDLQKTGELSGAIAHFAAKDSIPARVVSKETLISAITDTGLYQPRPETDVIDTRTHTEPVQYPKTQEELLSLLRTNAAGLAILAALRGKEKPLMLSCLDSEEETLRFNAACALALMRDKSGEEILLDNLVHRDKTLSDTSRNFNMTRGITSLYLLGVLESEKAIRPIFDLLNASDSLEAESVPSDEFFFGPDDYRFAYISHAMRALASIAHAHPGRKAEIRAFVKKRAWPVSYHLKGSQNLPFDGTKQLADFIEKYL